MPSPTPSRSRICCAGPSEDPRGVASPGASPVHLRRRRRAFQPDGAPREGVRGRRARVAFATDPGFVGHVRGLGFEAFPAGLDMPEARRRFAERTPGFETSAVGRMGYLTPGLFGGVRVEPMLDDLDRILPDWRPDLLIHEFGRDGRRDRGGGSGHPSCRAFVRRGSTDRDQASRHRSDRARRRASRRRQPWRRRPRRRAVPRHLSAGLPGSGHRRHAARPAAPARGVRRCARCRLAGLADWPSVHGRSST